MLYSILTGSSCSSGNLALFGSSWYHRRPLRSLGGNQRIFSRAVHGNRDAGARGSRRSAPAFANKSSSSSLTDPRKISSCPPTSSPPTKRIGKPFPSLIDVKWSKMSAAQDAPLPPEVSGSESWSMLLISTRWKRIRALSSACRAACDSTSITSAKRTTGCRDTSLSTQLDTQVATLAPDDSLLVSLDLLLMLSPVLLLAQPTQEQNQ
mmetsp:Transcript_1634/g.5021  ORF Transcript_1634/g.5021 Transcript_1634/m.5021 type:complete len:208 (-) Transcript_1634:296-919(-)